MTTPDSTPIADRVRFWEEQDKINQELIPRVIRQHELLTAHIADHENLPLIAGDAISEALSEAREEQHRHYAAALEVATQELQQQYDAALEAARQEQQHTTKRPSKWPIGIKRSNTMRPLTRPGRQSMKRLRSIWTGR